jgi:hypothetical protein
MRFRLLLRWLGSRLNGVNSDCYNTQHAPPEPKQPLITCPHDRIRLAVALRMSPPPADLESIEEDAVDAALQKIEDEIESTRSFFAKVLTSIKDNEP